MNRHDALVRRAGKVDRYGDPVDGTTVTEFVLPGCVLAPRASSEVNNYSDTVLVEFTLLAPASPAVQATDEVVVDDVTYAVDGDPSVWSSPFAGWRPGQQVALRRVRG